jgi:hypothetical protein
MIIAIVGEPGCGKSILQTWFIREMHKKGYHIYVNYKLYKIPYVPLQNITDMEELKTEPNLIVLDEDYLNSDARRSSSFMNMISTRHIMQHRKKKADVIVSAQLFETMDRRIRQLVSWVITPQIIRWSPEGVPEWMIMNIYQVKEEKEISIPLYLGNVPFMYDTFQTLEALETEDTLGEMIDKYMDYDGDLKKLAPILVVEEGLSKSDAQTVVKYIDAKR